MWVKKLSLTNYRGIGEGEISFDRYLTLIVGQNGVGKTTILDALAATVEPIQSLWPRPGIPSRGIALTLSPTDVRFGMRDCSITLEADLALEDESASKRTFKASYDEITSGKQPESYLSLYLYFQQLEGRLPPATLAVYYRQDRGFVDRSRIGETQNADQVFAGSLAASLQAIGNLETWWDKRDAQEARESRDSDHGFRDPQLEAIRNLIKEIDGFKSIKYQATRSPEGLYLTTSQGTEVHISQLSSGQRSFIILLADLARRLQIMHPNIALNGIPAIVLIDEIELNLHPAWQSKILVLLRKVFPLCQFIVTTHSPQVLSSVESEHVRVITPESDGLLRVDVPLSTKGRTSNYLLEGVFGAPERSPEIDALFDLFNNAIDAGDAVGAELLLTRIKNAVDGDPPELLALKTRLKRLASQI